MGWDGIPRQVWEVNAGWEVMFCQTREGADLYAASLRRRHDIIGVTDTITIEEITIYGEIPEGDRIFIEGLIERNKQAK